MGTSLPSWDAFWPGLFPHGWVTPICWFWVFEFLKKTPPGLRNERLNMDEQYLSNLAKFLWRLPSLSGRSSAPRGAFDLDPFLSVRQLQTIDHGCWNFWKSPLGAWDMAVEKVVTKSVTFASILEENWRLPFLNGHSSAPRGSNDSDPFSPARVLPDPFEPDL